MLNELIKLFRSKCFSVDIKCKDSVEGKLEEWYTCTARMSEPLPLSRDYLLLVSEEEIMSMCAVVHEISPKADVPFYSDETRRQI